MMRAFILVVLMVIGVVSFTQGTIIELKPVVRNDDTGKPLGGATIEVFKNGSLFASESSGSNGKVKPIELPVCIGCTYKIKIKKDGFVTKTAIVDGHSDYPEELPPGVVVQKFEVTIFESVEGIDFSFLEREPMVEFAIDSYGIVDFDQQKIKIMLKKIADLRKRMEEKKEELEKEAKEKEKQEADFNAYVEAGDRAMKQTEYEKAIGQYELALDIKPTDQPTKNKIEDAKIKLEELRANAQLNEDFAAKMKEAKDAYSGEELEKALTLYKEASAIKPSEKLPKDLILEIEKKLAEQKQNEAAFNKLVADGDGAMGKEDFDQAISKYNEALNLKKDGAVETKLAEAKKKKAEKEGAEAAEKENQKKYDNLIAKADAEFDTEKYEDAKRNYQEALKVKPTETKPTEKIAEIEKILKDRAADIAAKEKLEADYTKLIAEGKEKINQREWEDAKNKFEAALDIKSNDPTALAQIELIRKEMEKEAGEAKINAEYDALMTEANSLFSQDKLSEAKSKFSQAADVKPSEQAPKDKIAEIDRLLADQANAAEKEEEYKKHIANGDAAADRKSYAEALNNYKKALDIKPNDTSAKSKIDAINDLIAAQNKEIEEQKKFDDLVAQAVQSYNAKDYEKAKLNYTKALDIKEDNDIKEKIKEIDKLIAQNQSESETKEKYEAAIKDADALYQSNNYTEALEKYQTALSIKEDNYPKEKISELKEKIAAKEDAEAKEKAFTDLVAKADEAYDAKDYSKALSNYKEAIKVKPDPEITRKIGDIGVLLTQESQNAEKREEYDRKISEADIAFADENWNGAISLYEEASRVLPTETYPDEQITEVEKRMAAESANEAERNYQKIISKADALFKEDKLEDAKGYYDRAIGIKPSDSYVTEQLEKIATIKRDRANATADEKRLNEQYDAFIKDGERAMDASNWQSALENFKEALKLKPTEAYPTNKIAEIEGKMGTAELERQKEEEYKELIAKADQLFTTQDYSEAISYYNDALDVKSNEPYPKGKIVDAENFLKLESKNEVEAAYQKILTAAQKNFDDKNYEKALDLYLRAKKTKPSDPLPQERIDEINQIILKLGESDKLEEKYTDLIKEADYQYEKGDWKKAKDSYTDAFNVFNRKYPEDRIKECEGAMKTETSVEENKQYDKIIAKADEYFNKANYPKAQGLYKRAIGFKPQDQYPKDQLKEIDKLLNPNVAVKQTTNLKDYGDPNRSVNAIDIDAMLADAEQQRKFISAEKANQQEIDAANAEEIDDKQQTNYNFETRESVLLIQEDMEVAGVVATEAGVLASEKVDVMAVNQEDVVRDRQKWNENDIQIQNQIITNLNEEISEKNDESDLPREAYLLDVEEIRSGIRIENELNDIDQTNETFVQKDYVTNFEENRIEGDPNMDISRKNMEIFVEDQTVRLINETNENTWDQEDVTFKLKERTEIEISERTAFDINRDIPRVESVPLIENENIELADITSNRVDDQYDVSIDQKKFTENLATEIELENIGNDIPRERMEDFSEDQILNLIDENEDLTMDQNNVLFKTDIVVEEFEIQMEKDKVEDDLNREGYEKNVEVIKEDKEDFLKNKDSETLNTSHETVNYLEDRSADRRNIDEQADQDANDLIDHTENSVEEMVEETGELAEKSKVDLENSEDFVESLRDINIKKIDAKMKNTLGDQFPEGVTEEIYTINDEDGLIVSYVVRRIVVRNGVGDVYEKVQTKFGTTSYTSNGAGITEYDWQDQTEAADLVRN